MEEPGQLLLTLCLLVPFSGALLALFVPVGWKNAVGLVVSLLLLGLVLVSLLAARGLLLLSGSQGLGGMGPGRIVVRVTGGAAKPEKGGGWGNVRQSWQTKRVRGVRRWFRRGVPLLSGGALGAAFLMLVAIFGALVFHGSGSIEVAFLFEPMREAGAAGGVFYQIIGTLILLATTCFLVVPLALALGVVRVVHLERRPVVGRLVDDALQMLNGVPSIVFGIVGMVFFFQVLGWGKSWVAGGVVLAVMILPTVTVALVARLRAVPKGQIEAGRALGLRRHQLIPSIFLRQSWGGLFSGLFLGLARAAGETAPILFVAAVFAGAGWPDGISDAPVAALPYHIFTLAQDSLDEAAQANVWGAALVLVGLVALFNLLAYPLRKRQFSASRPF
ncbi:MAG: ABC transporter permease subunit [Opitutales bacterium]|nr:ABC transporter permease subunit [Opitutales bacterium]